MRKISELKNERANLIAQLEKISEKETLTDELRKEFDELESQIEILNKDIERAEKAERLNKLIVENSDEEFVEADESRSLGEQFRDFLKDAVAGKGPLSFRADPILTSTQAGIINKTVANSVDILTSPGEQFLRDLGVTFYPGLTGNFVVPALAEDTAEFVNEAGDASTSNMAHEALTLAARRVSAYQGITRETLGQTNPAIYNSIIQNLINGIWNAVTYDVFDNIQTDAAGQVVTTTAGGLDYGDIVAMEASIGGLNIGSGAYVTTPTVKGYLKQKVLLGTDNGPIWIGNEVNGYPAYGVPAANANKIYFGDFSKVAVGQWGGIEIIVDPYTKAKQGEYVLTAIGMFDTGVINKRGLVWTTDVSASY